MVLPIGRVTVTVQEGGIMAIDDGTAGNGFDRRTVLRTTAWAAPVVAIAVAAPAAAASTTPSGRSTLGFGTSSAFYATGAPWYQIYVGLDVTGTTSDQPVSSVVMQLTIQSTEGELVFEPAEFNAGEGDGWIAPELDETSREYTLTWAGGPLQAGTGTSFVAPIGFKIHATSVAQPTSFTVVAFSEQANQSEPKVQLMN